MLSAELHEKNQLLEEMKTQKERYGLDSSARIANLNQALLQSKQTCAQLENRNEELAEQEKMLLVESQTLERKCKELSMRLEGPCKLCRERQQLVQSKHDDELHKSVSAPNVFKPLPERTEIDMLLVERGKLQQKYDCLFANFQMVSEKSTQLKKETKDKDKALSDLEVLCESLQTENQDLKKACDTAKEALSIQQDKNSLTMNKQSQMRLEAADLSKHLEDIQSRHSDLRGQHSDMVIQLQNTQDTIANLRSQVSTLKVEKAENEKELAHTQTKIDELVEDLEKYKELSQSSSQTSQSSSEAIESYEQKLKYTDR